MIENNKTRVSLSDIKTLIGNKKYTGVLGFLFENKKLTCTVVVTFFCYVALIYIDTSDNLGYRMGARIFTHAVSFLIIFSLIFYRYFEVEVIQSREEEKGHISLNRYMWFRRSFDISVFVAIWVSIAIMIENSYAGDLAFCLRWNCFNRFYEVFKIPFLIVTAGMAVSGIVAAVYRSIETGKQIKISETKNNFDIYTKHRELFFSDIDNVVSNPLVVNDIYKINIKKDYIYSVFFNENTYSDFKDYRSKKSADEIFYYYFQCFSSEPFKGSIKPAMDSLGVYLLSTATNAKIPYQNHLDKSQIMNFMSLMHEQLGEKYCRP